MKLSWRRASSLLTALALSVTGVTALATSAHAAGDTNVRLITPVVTANNSVDHQDYMGGWIGNGWYEPGSTFKKMYAPVGASINLTYQATDANGNPVSGKTLTLHVNKGWSSSNAALTSGSTSIGGSNGGDDGGQLTAVTDAFGQATFNLVDTDTTSTENNPAKLTDEPAGSSLLYSQIYPSLGSDLVSGDMIEFHFVNTMPNAASAGADAYLSAVGPVLNDNNSVSQQGNADYYVSQGWYASGLKFRQAYAKVGSAFNQLWQYTDANGNPLAGQQVQLVVNKAWSGSTASMASGSTSIAPTNGGNDSAVLSATTDSFGVASFALSNTNSTSAEADPASLTTAPTGTQLYSQTFAQVAGAASHSALIEYHFVNNPPAIAAPTSTPSPTGTPTVTPTPTPTYQGPAVANIRLLSTLKDVTKDTFLTPGWYNPDGDASPAYIKYGTVGETTTLTYVATDGSGAPIKNTSIWLLVNSPGEHASYTKSNGSALDVAPTQAAWWNGYQGNIFGGAVQGTTDAAGKVTFVVKNTNTFNQGESIRTVKNDWADSSNGNTLQAGFYPTMQATTEHIDRLWYHLTSKYVVPTANIRLINTLKDTSKDTADVTYWWAPDGSYSPAYLKYFTAGSTISLTYVVTDAAGKPVTKAPIWLNVNEGGNNATFTKANGSPLDAAKTGWKFVGYDSATFAGSVSGTTDSKGQVTFTLVNTNSSADAENIRDTANAWSSPTGSELKAAFYPTMAGAALEHIDRVWGHIVKMPAPKMTAGASSAASATTATVPLSFTLKNGLGKPLANTKVNFQTNSAGTLSASSGTTDKNGLVKVTASGTATGSQLVTASYVDADSNAAVATTTISWTRPAAKASVSVSGKSISVVVTNGMGYSQVVKVTGLSDSTKTLTSMAATTSKFTVKKAGKYTVVVTVNGKELYNSSVTVN